MSHCSACAFATGIACGHPLEAVLTPADMQGLWEVPDLGTLEALGSPCQAHPCLVALPWAMCLGELLTEYMSSHPNVRVPVLLDKVATTEAACDTRYQACACSLIDGADGVAA